MARIAPPRDGEPIRLFWTALDNISGARTKGSEPRYRVRLDAEPDPKTGKRRQVWSTHDTLTGARAHVAADRKRGVLVVVSRLTVAQLLDGWLLSARHLKPSTRHGYQVHLKPVRDRLGTIEVQRLTKASVEEFVEHMLRTGGRKGEGRAPSTVRQTLVILEQAMDDAERQGMVVRNVVRLVAKPRQVRQEMKTWTAEQLTTFLDAARGDRFAALWRVAAFGLRRSEVAGLRWQDVDVEAECARVVQTRVTVDGKTVVTGEPAGMLPDFGGPEIRDFKSLAESWRRARGLGKPMFNLPLPFKASRQFAAGHLLCPDHRDGKITFEQYLDRKSI